MLLLGAIAQYHTGDCEAATAQAQDVLERASTRGATIILAWAELVRAESMLRTGHTERAAPGAQRAFELATRAAMRIDRVRALVVLGRAAVADHRWDDAAALLVGAADELDGRPAPSMYTVDAHAGPPELTADLLEADHGASVDLDAIAHRGLTVLRSYAAAVPIATPRLHLVNGRLEYLRGRHAAARRSFDRAGRTAERFGMPWEAQEAARRLAAIAQHR